MNSSMSMIKFRELTPDDLDDIHKIEKESFDHPWKPEQLLYEIESSKVAKNYGLFENSKLVAYILCHFIQNELHINNLAVAKSERRKGFGKDLLVQTSEQLNPESMYLEVDVQNEAAIKMYEKMGFRSFYTRKNYYENGSDALIMIR